MSGRDRMLPLEGVRTRIMRVWLIGAGSTAFLLVVISILRGRSDAARDIWSWFLPLVLPTLGLMIGVVGAAAAGGNVEGRVRKSFVDIAIGLSMAYLAVLALTVLMEPFSPLKGSALYAMSNYYLGPFQGLVVAALGYLFTSGKSTPDAPGKKQDD